MSGVKKTFLSIVHPLLLLRAVLPDSPVVRISLDKYSGLEAVDNDDKKLSTCS